MKKFLIICISIVTVIVVSDVLLQKYLFNDFEYMISIFSDIDVEENRDVQLKKIEELENHWKNKYLLMAFYIDHGELEKIRNQIVVIKAGIEKDDVPFVHEETKRSIYIIEHIEEKITLKFDNIL